MNAHHRSKSHAVPTRLAAAMAVVVAMSACLRPVSSDIARELRRASGSSPVSSLRFAEEEWIAGTGLRRVVSRPSAQELISLVHQQPTDGAELESTYCSTLALIKAAMMQFGVDGVARSIERRAEDGALVVTLRNGDAVTLAPWKLELVRRWVHFAVASDPRGPLLSNWFRLYVAVAAERMLNARLPGGTRVGEQPEGCPAGEVSSEETERRWFRAALATITNGFYADRTPPLLGLVEAARGHSSALNQTLFRQMMNSGAIIWTMKHTMFATALETADNAYVVVDLWGDPKEAHTPWYQFVLLREPTDEPSERRRSELDLSPHRRGVDWDPPRDEQGFICNGTR